MKVVWTDAAAADLEDILLYSSEHYRRATPSLEMRLREVVKRIGHWPASARIVSGLSDVRTTPVTGYPFRLFYRLEPDRVVILHVRHASRSEWPGRKPGQ